MTIGTEEENLAVLDAFKKDDFSMEKILPISEVGNRTRMRAEGMVRAAKELAGILTPEQRADLVKRMESKTTSGAPEEEVEPGGAPQAEPRGETQQSIVVSRGYRAGAVGGWGGGGYAARRTTVRTGYAGGYPLVGGYGPGVW